MLSDYFLPQCVSPHWTLTKEVFRKLCTSAVLLKIWILFVNIKCRFIDFMQTLTLIEEDFNIEHFGALNSCIFIFYFSLIWHYFRWLFLFLLTLTLRKTPMFHEIKKEMQDRGLISSPRRKLDGKNKSATFSSDIGVIDFNFSIFFNQF